MLKGKSLLDYTNYICTNYIYLFSPNGYEKNDKIFSITKNMKKIILC